MPANTPARIALREAERTLKMPRFQHKITCLKCAEEQLSKLNITWENAKIFAQDRTYWKYLTKNQKKKTFYWLTLPVPSTLCSLFNLFLQKINPLVQNEGLIEAGKLPNLIGHIWKELRQFPISHFW